MKKLFSKKAFTLVEVIVATAIMGLLIAAVMALFGPVRGIISGLDENIYLNMTTDNLSNYVYNCLNRSTTYNIGAYTADQLVADESEDSVAKRIGVMIADIDDPSCEDVRCLLIKASDATGYRLYDLGKIATVNDYFTKINNYSRYALFSEDYYQGANFKFAFTTSSSGGSSDQKWCKISVTPFDMDGSLIIEERSHMFKLLNMSLTNVAPVSSPSLTNLEYSNDTEIVIIYRIKDFSK